jgi:Zn-dependent peptidase ImmA (M78 family)
MRKAARLRTVAKELMESLGEETRPQLSSASTSDNPEELSKHERERLGISLQTQLEWRNEREAFRAWRGAVEKLNLLVFQIPMPVEDARGFSLSGDPPFAIVVNRSDAVHARIFTLFHEYAHLLLRRPGICLPRAGLSARKPEVVVERWSNSFAGALLVPRAAFVSLTQEGRIALDADGLPESMAVVSRLFRVSKEAALIRIFELELISRRLFQQEMERLQSRAVVRKRSGGRFSAVGKCIGENGRLFTSLVLEAKSKNLISYADMADYLSISLKYLPEIQSNLNPTVA